MPKVSNSSTSKKVGKKTSTKQNKTKTSTKTPVVETPVVETPVVETPVAETPVVETPVVETPVVETPVVETPVVEIPVAETTTEEVSVADEFTSLLTALTDVQKHIKSLTTQVRGLQKHVTREHRDLEKASRSRRKRVVDPNKPKRAPSGFAKPTGLSPELCTFLGVDADTQLARTDVTKQITTYVKEHELQNPENKKIILPDTNLGSLLNVPSDETLTYFNLQRYMKVHFQKAGVTM